MELYLKNKGHVVLCSFLTIISEHILFWTTISIQTNIFTVVDCIILVLFLFFLRI